MDVARRREGREAAIAEVAGAEPTSACRTAWSRRSRRSSGASHSATRGPRRMSPSATKMQSGGRQPRSERRASWSRRGYRAPMQICNRPGPCASIAVASCVDCCVGPAAGARRACAAAPLPRRRTEGRRSRSRPDGADARARRRCMGIEVVRDHRARLAHQRPSAEPDSSSSRPSLTLTVPAGVDGRSRSNYPRPGQQEVRLRRRRPSCWSTRASSA